MAAVVAIHATKLFNVFGRPEDVPFNAFAVIKEILLHESVVVIDSGTFSTRIGFANNATSVKSFRTMTATSNSHEGLALVGQEAISKHRGALELQIHHPIDRGVVVDWKEMERVWAYAFYTELKLDPADCTVLLTEPMFNPKAHRERTVQMMFDDFHVGKLYLCTCASLAMEQAGGKTIGLVVELGAGLTQIVPMYEGYAMTQGIKLSAIAGEDINEALQHLVHGISSATAEGIKTTMCYVALDFAQEMNAPTSSAVFTLPDGSLLGLTQERFKAGELLFQPNVFGMSEMGLHELIMESLFECGEDMLQALLGSIVLSGNTALLPGLHARLTNELHAMFPRHNNIMEIHPLGQDAVWHGGTKLASSPTFQHMFISRVEYESTGSEVVHLKCF